MYYIIGHWGELLVTNDTVYLSFHFGVIFVYYHQICVASIFISFFDEATKIPWQNFNQSEARIGDKKLSVKLYAYTETKET